MVVDHKKNGKTCPLSNSEHSGNEIEAGCSVFKDYLTGDEEKVLSQIRELWKESRKIKSRLKELDSAIKVGGIDKGRSGDLRADDLNGKASKRVLKEWRQCTRRLEELRAERKRLEHARKEANRIKMILLGHLD